MKLFIKKFLSMMFVFDELYTIIHSLLKKSFELKYLNQLFKFTKIISTN